MFRENIDGVDIKLVFSNIKLEDKEIQRLRNCSFIDEFPYWIKIIYAHYGKLKVTPDHSSVTYLITIPLRLSEIRPKKKDIPDNIGKLFSMLHDRIYQEKQSFKKQAIKNFTEIGIDKEVVTRVIDKIE